MSWFTWLFSIHREHPPLDPAEIREEMSRTDPDFVHVRRVQHEALQALTAKRIADGLAIREERRFWERVRPPEVRTDDG